MELRQTAECERILQVAWHARLPKAAACEKLAEAAGGGLQANVRPLPKHRVQDGRVGDERLHLERPATSSASARRVQSATAKAAIEVENESLSTMARPSPASSRRPTRSISAAATSPIGARSAWPTEPSVRIVIGQRSLSACTTNSASSGRTPVCAAGEIVRQPQEGASDDVIARRRALADPAVHDQQPVELVDILRIEATRLSAPRRS